MGPYAGAHLMAPRAVRPEATAVPLVAEHPEATAVRLVAEHPGGYGGPPWWRSTRRLRRSPWWRSTPEATAVRLVAEHPEATAVPPSVAEHPEVTAVPPVVMAARRPVGFGGGAPEAPPRSRGE